MGNGDGFATYYNSKIEELMAQSPRKPAIFYGFVPDPFIARSGMLGRGFQDDWSEGHDVTILGGSGCEKVTMWPFGQQLGNAAVLAELDGRRSAPASFARAISAIAAASGSSSRPSATPAL